MTIAAPILLTPLDEVTLPTIQGWFADAESRHRLGGMLPVREWFVRIRDDARHHTWVAHADETAIGLVSLERYDDGTASIGLLIDPAQRRKGYGARILCAALAHATSLGCARIEAEVEVDNLAGQHCAEAAGFSADPDAQATDGFLALVYDPATTRDDGQNRTTRRSE